MKSIIYTLLDIIAPSNCLECGQEGALLCEWCWPDAFEMVPNRCAFCLRANDNSAVCARCRKQSPLAQVWVGTVYKGMAKSLVQHVKFNPDRSGAYLIAQYLDQTMPYFDAAIVVTHVPTARTRVRQRGFDHAALVAKEFAHRRGLQFRPLLQREGSSRQVGSEKKQRATQVSGAYHSMEAPPASVIIIDDIMTTGATLNEVARTLKHAGAKTVNAIVFAQTI